MSIRGMSAKDITRYRNLANWTNDDWESLNIHLFVLANYNRYCSLLIKRIGIQYLPSDATEALQGIFCDIAFKPMQNVHQRHLHETGERRNQVMLGSLKMIASTRIIEALIKEFPAYFPLELLTHLDRCEDDDVSINDAATDAVTDSHSLEPMLLASSIKADHLMHESEGDREYNTQTEMMESIRHYLTPSQFKHLRFVICEKLTPSEIAKVTGHSVTNVRIMLLNARRNMHKLVPHHLQASTEDCLRRKPNNQAA